MEEIRAQKREQRIQERKLASDQNDAAALVNKRREENIRSREKERDRKFAGCLKEEKDKKEQQRLRSEASKHAKRLELAEQRQKEQEERDKKREIQQQLDALRNDNIANRSSERNQREQSRIK